MGITVELVKLNPLNQDSEENMRNIVRISNKLYTSETILDYGANPFGRPLDKKSDLDRLIKGVDLRTPSESSKHNQEVFFNKKFK